MATTASSAPTEAAAPVQQQAPATATTTAGAPAAAPSQVESASLYVGDLLPSVTEAIIYEIFNPVAPVVSVRVRRDNSRSSLGHALISFQSRADAERAMDALNFTNIKGKPCRIMWMQRDNTARVSGTGNIFIKNLDPSIDNKALMDTFSLFGKVLSCVVVTNRETGESLGYGYVHFESTEDADEAIKKTNGMLINGREVHVDWFQKPSDRHAQKSFTNIYVKNIPVHWNEERLKTLFSESGEVSSVAIMKDETGKSKGFGFIDFAKGEAALNAISKFNDFEVKTKEGEEAGAEGAAAPKEAEKSEAAEEGEKSAASEGEPIPASTAPKLTQRLVVCKAQMKEERAKELRAHFEKEKQERMAKYQGVNLFVKNLHENVDDDMLRKEFTPFGTITSARVMREHQPGSKTLGASKCFGFVCFTSPEEAMKAVTEMNGKQILGKPIYVGLAQRKDERRVELEQQFARSAMIGRNVAGGIPLPVGGPQGMYPGAQVYFQQGPGIRGAPFNFLPQMMPRGAVAGGRPGIPYGANSARGYPGNMGFQPQQQGQMGFGPGMMMGPRPRGDGRQSQGQNIKYTAGARNHPMGAYNQGMGGQMMPPMPMMPNGMMMPGQQPQPHIQAAPEPLTAAALANASEEQQKNMIGERLYPLIEAVQPNLAGKITGMLLEMDNPELLHLIESPEALQTKITEALNVLESHDQDKPSE